MPKINPTQIDWAMLAAYIDGEGCIELRHVSKSKPIYSLVITISNTNPLLSLWLRDRFDGKILKKHIGENNHRRPAFNWCCYTKLAEKILQNCLPYFVIKRHEAEIGIAYRATVHKAGGDRKSQGAILTPEIASVRQSLKRQIGEAKRSFPINSLPDDFITEFIRSNSLGVSPIN